MLLNILKEGLPDIEKHRNNLGLTVRLPLEFKPIKIIKSLLVMIGLLSSCLKRLIFKLS